MDFNPVVDLNPGVYTSLGKIGAQNLNGLVIYLFNKYVKCCKIINFEMREPHAIFRP